MGRKTNPVNRGRVAMSLGASDTRYRRNAAGALLPENNLDRTLQMDANGREGIAGSRRVADVPSGATLEDLIAKVNEILQGQRDSGQMLGGR